MISDVVQLFLSILATCIRSLEGNMHKISAFLKDFIYSFDRDRDSQREREHKQGEWERKKQASSGGA